MAKITTASSAGFLTRLNAAFRRFRGDRDGVGAVEFALIAPFLIVLYIGSLEVSVAMSVNKKLARASSTVADLVTQQETVDKAYLASMVNVAQSVIAPFKTSTLKVKITAIRIDASNKATVAWSWKDDGSPVQPKGSAVSVPSQLNIASTFLVRAQLNLDYDVFLLASDEDGSQTRHLNMGKTYHLRPRVISGSITCTDCS
ncbi:pilus assembly protein [Pseudohoeflea suaedae]|uniref:Pilus assembly protein n=1 Tax=Pseudohoeflea suaedae TaxID=877384 RepID=A0A4R5PM19_9HYPH|nr:TadE/TadG family type IV pilus assembly protein [Pseudohoeflea suaedae]TDH37919.1 pilus assembly protein [Pseudohoeflea suaedae]